MELQRTILIALFALVSVMLFQTWDETYNAPVQQTANASVSLPGDTPEAASGLDSEVPAASITGSAVAQAISSKTIKIRTDLLALEVDLQGGTIVQADLLAFPESLGSEVPFRLMSNTPNQSYVAQSGLSSIAGPDNRDGRAVFAASADSFEMVDGQDKLVVPLTWTNEQGVEFTKLFTFTRGNYAAEINYKVDNQSGKTYSGSFYAQLKRHRPLEEKSVGLGGFKTYTGAAVTTPDENYHQITFDDMDDEVYKKDVKGGWVAMIQHYFVSAWVPAADQVNSYSSRANKGEYLVQLVSPTLSVAPGQTGEIGSTLWIGPKDQNKLDVLSENLDLTIDYGWLWFIAQPLFWLLTMWHGLFGNWGWAIIFLTITVKALFFYPSAISYRSMAKMRKLAPKLAQLKERYGDDRQQIGTKTMELYKKEGANPMTGCLPVLLQMPVFIALYWTLLESVELRLAPWLGWITDLSAQDPYYILPVIMAASMFIQQKLNPPPADPMQQKVMQFLPVVFGVFFLFFPAGLVLYWCVNNILSILQQWMITRKIEAAD